MAPVKDGVSKKKKGTSKGNMLISEGTAQVMKLVKC